MTWSDGCSLDDKRQSSDNDIPDVLTCWQNRRDAKFLQNARNVWPNCKKQIAPAQNRPHGTPRHHPPFEV